MSRITNDWKSGSMDTKAWMIGSAMCILAALGMVAWIVYDVHKTVTRDISDAQADALKESERMRFVRMPQRPEICVAGFPGEGGFGPVFMGGYPCAQIDGPISTDEGLTADLGTYEVLRIGDSHLCMAYAARLESFTLPCAPHDGY